nr:HNH endonuclease [uncultured Rhodopila sp.]
MPKLSKQKLVTTVEDAIRDSGWSFLRFSKPKDHPADYQVYRDAESYPVRVYIWNLSHGGGEKRPLHEFRIQITGIQYSGGIQQFQPRIDGKTLILGWWPDAGVFAGFDYAYHIRPLGVSPSIQVGEAALRAAHLSGFAPHNRHNGELAIAFRPDFLGTYIQNLEPLHACGRVPSEIEILDQIATDPASVGETQIQGEVATSRQCAVVTTTRALRDLNFRARVLTAYGHQCAMCGVQLKLLDAAHVLPVAHPHSTDETCNGVALCALHHRAYDKAFVTFDEKFQIRHNAKIAMALKVSGHDGGLASFTQALRSLLILPQAAHDRPAAAFVKEANSLRGW